MKTQWFYSIQKNLLDKLHYEYVSIECMYQEITKTKVFECYSCYKSLNEKPVILLAVLNKYSQRFCLFNMIEK